MKLNSVEWARAQELLLKLVQVVGPFASREPIPPQNLTFPLARRFFVPPSEDLRFRNEARLLTTLADAKKEVEDWIGKLPETEANLNGKTSKANPDPSQKKELAAFKNDVSNRNGATPSNAAGKSREANAAINSASFAPKPLVASQAQQVIDQVRQAILALSSSAFLVDPKAGPLRDALKRLKPFIDQLIEAVSQEGMHSAGEGLPQLFRFKISPTEREAMLKKLIQFPQSEKRSRRSFSDSSVVKENKANPAFLGNPSRKTSDETQLAASKDSLASENKESIDDSRSFKAISNNPMHSLTPDQKQERPADLDRTTIPGAPYTAQTQSNSFSRKTKKKRRGFFFQDEEELEDETRQKQ